MSALSQNPKNYFCEFCLKDKHEHIPAVAFVEDLQGWTHPACREHKLQISEIIDNQIRR